MRKRFKIPLFTIGAIILLIVAAFLWLTQTGWLKNRANEALNGILAKSTNLRVELGRLGGNGYSNLTVDHVVIFALNPEPETLAVIPRVSFAYDIQDAWRLHAVREVRITAPQLFLPADSIPAFVQSLKKPGGGGGSSGAQGFAFYLPSIILEDGRIHKGDIVYVDSLNLECAVTNTSDGLTARLNRGSLDLADLGAVTLSGKYVGEAGGWSVDSVAVATSRSHFRGAGSADGWSLDAAPLDSRDADQVLHLGIDGVLTYTGTITPPHGESGWSGNGRIDGHYSSYELSDMDADFAVDNAKITFHSVSGRVNGTACNGWAYVDLGVKPETYGYDGSFRHFNLSRWVADAMPSDLSGRIELSGQGLTNQSLALAVNAQLAPGHFDNFAIDSAWGDFDVTTEDIVFHDDFNLQREWTHFVGNGRIGFADTIDVLMNFDSRDLRPWDSLVFVDSLQGQANGYVYLSGPTADPNLAGRVVSDSIRLYEITSNDFEAWFYSPHFMTNPDGSIDVRVGPASVWGWAVDSILLRAELSGTELTIDSAAVASPDIVFNGRGRLNWASDTIPVALYPLSLRWEDQWFTAGDTVALEVAPDGVELGELRVDSELGTLNLSGWVNYDQTVNLRFAVDGVEIGPTWHRVEPDININGDLACTGTLKGRLDTPNISLQGEIRDLTYDSLLIGNLSGDLSYWDEHLRTERLHLSHPDHTVTVTGEFPFRLRLDKFAAQVLDEPMRANLSATGDALEIAAYFLPETIESIEGPFSMSAALEGTPKAPLITGQAHLRSSTIKAVEILNPIEDVQIDLVFHQDTIEIQRAVGTIRDKKRTGTVTGSGTVRLVSYNEFAYRLKLMGRKVPARFEFEDFYVETDFDLNVLGSSPPLVSGVIRPKRVEDRAPFEEETTTAPVDTTVWDWDMTVELPGNYWIHNDQMDAELSADLRLLRNKGHATYLGTAEIIRGKIYLFDKIGHIQRGILTFDDTNTPDPQLDIDVQFPIRQPRADQSVGGSATPVLDLDLHISGRASEPLIQATNKDQNYTEQDVLMLLAANTTSGNDPLSDRLRFAATGLLFSEVQRVAARKLGLETLEINSDGTTTSTEITVGRYFSQHLYLYGTSPIDAAGGQEVGFEYRLNRRLYLEGGRDRDNLYRLNLHLNWDF